MDPMARKKKTRRWAIAGKHKTGENTSTRLHYTTDHTRRQPRQIACVLADMLTVARRRLHGDRDASIEAALLALALRWGDITISSFIQARFTPESREYISGEVGR